MNQLIEDFLGCTRFAVVGASTNRAKYGNKVLRSYLQDGRAVTPVHPRERAIEGVPAYASLSDVPETPEAVSIITPPAVSLAVIDEAAELGIRHVWLQPGAESADVLNRARERGLDVIAGGPCLLVVLGFRENG